MTNNEWILTPSFKYMLNSDIIDPIQFKCLSQLPVMFVRLISVHDEKLSLSVTCITNDHKSNFISPYNKVKINL